MYAVKIWILYSSLTKNASLTLENILHYDGPRAGSGVVRIDPLRKTPTNSYIMMCLASKPILIASFQHNEKIDNPLSETVLCIYFASL